MNRQSDEFVSLLTSSQTSLYAYVLTLLPDRVAAQDVLQEVNLTIWHKAEDFEESTCFFAWASKIAYYHVLAYRRKKSRDRLIFDDDILEYLAERHAERSDEAQSRQRVLRECLAKLSPDQRQLVQQRYARGGSVQVIANNQGRTSGAVSQNLYRIRQLLLHCIEGKLKSVGLA